MRFIRQFFLRLAAWPANLVGLEVYRLNAHRVRSGTFCDYCSCDGCRYGEDHQRSLACTDGSHICDVCYFSEPCFDAVSFSKKRRGSTFCQASPHCRHKPRLSATEAS